MTVQEAFCGFMNYAVFGLTQCKMLSNQQTLVQIHDHSLSSLCLYDRNVSRTIKLQQESSNVVAQGFPTHVKIAFQRTA